MISNPLCTANATLLPRLRAAYIAHNDRTVAAWEAAEKCRLATLRRRTRVAVNTMLRKRDWSAVCLNAASQGHHSIDILPFADGTWAQATPSELQAMLAVLHTRLGGCRASAHPREGEFTAYVTKDKVLSVSWVAVGHRDRMRRVTGKRVACVQVLHILEAPVPTHEDTAE